MTKIVKTNHPNDIITLELSKSELEDILKSVDCITRKRTKKIIGEYTIHRGRTNKIGQVQSP